MESSPADVSENGDHGNHVNRLSFFFGGGGGGGVLNL